MKAVVVDNGWWSRQRPYKELHSSQVAKSRGGRVRRNKGENKEVNEAWRFCVFCEDEIPFHVTFTFCVTVFFGHRGEKGRRERNKKNIVLLPMIFIPGHHRSINTDQVPAFYLNLFSCAFFSASSSRIIPNPNKHQINTTRKKTT